jgi:hypothetical protein
VATTPGSVATRTWVTGREQARLKSLTAKWRADPHDLTPKELDKLAVLLGLWGRSHDVCTYDGLNIDPTITGIRERLDGPPVALTTTQRTERARRRRGTQPQPVPRHGTLGGYSKHRRMGDTACRYCREANADRSKVITGTMDTETAVGRQAARLIELGGRVTVWSSQ